MGVLNEVHAKSDNNASNAFSRYVSIIRFRSRWMPWQQSLAIIAFCISVLFTAILVVPASNHLNQLRQETQQLKHSIPKHQGQWTPQSPEASIGMFYEFLPTKKSINQILYVLHQAITEHGLIVERMEYRLATNPSSAFLRYQITFPVKGDYQEIRLFINQLLNTFPTLALSEFSLKRSDAQTRDIEAHIKLTIFLRSNG